MGRSLSQRIAGLVAVPGFSSLFGSRYHNFEVLDQFHESGMIVVANHITEIDPLVISLALHRADFTVHFLAKDSLFEIPVVGKLLSTLGQIPVKRQTAGAVESLEAAQQALTNGGAIVIYPEGTLTRDPELWPMRGHTGAARLALKTQVPVVPMAQDGAQELLAPYGRKLHWLPRKVVDVRCGKPLDLSPYYQQAMSKTVLEEVTEKMMAAISDELAVIRGKNPPAGRFNPRTSRYETRGQS